METNKSIPTGWTGVGLLAISIALYFIFSNPTNSKKPSDLVNTKNSQETESSLVKYSIGFDGNQGLEKTIDGKTYKNFVYFQVQPEQYMEYIYRSGEIVQFFSENPNDIIWIVDSKKDSIGSTISVTSDLSEDLGNSYYKVRLINKTAKKFGAGIVK